MKPKLSVEDMSRISKSYSNAKNLDNKAFSLIIGRGRLRKSEEIQKNG